MLLHPDRGDAHGCLYLAFLVHGGSIAHDESSPIQIHARVVSNGHAR